MQPLAPTVSTWADVTTPWGNSPAVEDFATDSHLPDSWANVATPWDSSTTMTPWDGPSNVEATSNPSLTRDKSNTTNTWAVTKTPWDGPSNVEGDSDPSVTGESSNTTNTWTITETPWDGPSNVEATSGPSFTGDNSNTTNTWAITKTPWDGPSNVEATNDPSFTGDNSNTTNTWAVTKTPWDGPSNVEATSDPSFTRDNPNTTNTWAVTKTPWDGPSNVEATNHLSTGADDPHPVSSWANLTTPWDVTTPRHDFSVEKANSSSANGGDEPAESWIDAKTTWSQSSPAEKSNDFSFRGGNRHVAESWLNEATPRGLSSAVKKPHEPRDSSSKHVSQPWDGARKWTRGPFVDFKPRHPPTTGLESARSETSLSISSSKSKGTSSRAEVDFVPYGTRGEFNDHVYHDKYFRSYDTSSFRNRNQTQPAHSRSAYAPFYGEMSNGKSIGSANNFGKTPWQPQSSWQPPPSWQPQPSWQPPPYAQPELLSTCRYFLRGNCKKGISCPFLHPSLHADTVPYQPQQPLMEGIRSSIVCRYFNLGTCNKGSSCKYLHSLEEGSLLNHNGWWYEPNKIHELTGWPEIPDNVSEDADYPFWRALSDLQDQVEGAEYSSNKPLSPVVPPLIPAVSILDCEVEFGDGASIKDIRVPLEYQKIADNEKLEPFETIRYELASSRQVKISWCAPTVSAWVHFSSLATAKERAKKLDGKFLGGQKLSVSFQTPKPGSGREFSKHRFAAASGIFSIEIRGLSISAQKATENLERFSGSSSITFGEPSYEREYASEKICRWLESFGPLESYYELAADENESVITAFAVYCDANSAFEAVNQLHDTPHDFLQYDHLWVEHVYFFRITVSLRHFLTLNSEFDLLLQSYGDSARLDYNYLDEDMVCIYVHSKDAKVFTRMEVDVERQLLGKALPADIWDEDLFTEGRQFVDDLNSQTSDYFVTCDTRAGVLRVCGNKEARDAANQAVIQKIKTLRGKRRVLPLGKEMLRGLLAGDLKKLEDEIGANKVSLDVVNLTLTIRGDESDVRIANRILAGLESVIPTTLGSAELDDSCPVCSGEAVDRVQLHCNHSYCSTCLLYLLRSHITSKFSEVACVSFKRVADSEELQACGAPIPLQVIRDLLSPEESSALMKASFLTHVREHSNEFRYCPTPNCNVIYRPQPRGTVFRCHACQVAVCAACHAEFHVGLTCAEYTEIELVNRQGLQNWNRNDIARKCPKCRAHLEKWGGRNDVECVMCRVHVCWLCMKSFQQGQVTEHMQEYHSCFTL